MNIKGTFAYLYPRIYALVKSSRNIASPFDRPFQHTLEENQLPPAMIRCSYERFAETGAYVVGESTRFPSRLLFISIRFDQKTVWSCTFGWAVKSIRRFFNRYSDFKRSHIFNRKRFDESRSSSPCDSTLFLQCRIVELDNPISRNVRALLNLIRNERDSYMKVRLLLLLLTRLAILFLQLFIIQQRDSIEPFFKNYLIEDKGFTGGASYVDFLYHLHREIRNILQ